MKWEGKVYIDGMLPFGLRSAPKIFNCVADAVEWCVSQEGVEHIFHYLDDFAVVGPAESQQCLQALLILIRVCAALGIPLAPDKQDGPTAVITLLGIIIDTIKEELRLPEDKLQRLIELAAKWEKRKTCTHRELESLIGTLHHATKVIFSGRSFLRRAIALLSVAKMRHHHIRLNAEFRADMAWWRVFSARWNGASLVVHPGSREVDLISDASGGWGCGAWQGSHWFQIEWGDQLRELHIAAKELIPVIVAAIVWGDSWKGCRVTAHCDNSAVVSVLNSRYCQDQMLMQMLRCLFFIEAARQFRIRAVHVAGVQNDLADDLSRNRLSSFLAKKTDADASPIIIPTLVLQWLLNSSQEWTSPDWMRHFNIFVPRE